MSKMSKGKKIEIITGSVIGVAAIAGVILFLSVGQNEPVEEVNLPEPTQPVTTEAFIIETESETEPPTTEPPELTDKAKELLEENPDTVGWITIEHTNVDNPIVQCGDNEFYLDHGFDGEPFRAGTVFMDYRDVFSWNEEEQSTNILLYGHNMANNTMFGSLRRYRQDYSYYKTAPIIQLESNYTSYEYVIFGLVITDGSAEATWRYWDMEDLSNRTQFNAYIKTVKQKNLTDIPVDVKYGDKLLTLSTCYSDADDSRFLVIARRLREDETADTFLKLFEEASDTE